MNLVVQGTDVDSIALKSLASVSHASAIEQITPQAFRLVGAQAHEQILRICAEARLDATWGTAGRKLKDFGLFVPDLDSTLINIECIDEIADMQGLKSEVSAITEAAMRGELDFRESLLRRVTLLAGLPESALEEVYEQRLRLNPGAEQLMKTLKATHNDFHIGCGRTLWSLIVVTSSGAAEIVRLGALEGARYPQEGLPNLPRSRAVLLPARRDRSPRARVPGPIVRPVPGPAKVLRHQCWPRSR
jgi:hypothetical protein